jgi:hypothetical protein
MAHPATLTDPRSRLVPVPAAGNDTLTAAHPWVERWVPGIVAFIIAIAISAFLVVSMGAIQ